MMKMATGKHHGFIQKPAMTLTLNCALVRFRDKCEKVILPQSLA
jgi:hypothetical protein